MAITETTHAGEFLISEANGARSREIVTVLSGQNLPAGQVCGAVEVGAGSSAAYAGNTGNGAMGAITVGAGAKAGVYKLTIIEPAANAGKFEVEDPDGIVIGTGTVAVAFAAGGLSFTLADGATDFIAGDGFDITVAEGSLKIVGIDADYTNGGQNAHGILYAAVDATGGDTQGVLICRDAEVLESSLDWGDLDAGEQAVATAQLKALGIIVKEAI